MAAGKARSGLAGLMADGISAERGLNPFQTHTHTHPHMYTHSTAWRQQNQYSLQFLCVNQWEDEWQEKESGTVYAHVCVVSYCLSTLSI